MIQGIPRSNGKQFVGNYDTIVSRGDTDFDTMPAQGHGPGGRFRCSFELCEGTPGIIASRPELVLIIEFHDDRNGSYRHGETFDNVVAAKEYCQKYDPCQHLPCDCQSPDVMANVRDRYNRRLQRFLELIEERSAAHK